MEKLIFRLRGGKILGRDHARGSRNCQDGYAFAQVAIFGQNYWIGVISDGCSGGENSEIAGIMLPVFVVQQIQHLLRFDTPLSQVPITLYPAIAGFLEAIRKQFPFGNPQEIVRFIQDHLLATIVGFVINENDGVVFHAGDGRIVLNDEIESIEYEKNPYIGYHLVPRSALGSGTSDLPRTFTSFPIESKDLDRLAVATDGFSENLLRRLFEEARSVPLGIQLWMNFINGPRNPNHEAGLFYDDASVVALERIKEETDA